jgi:hypothetical protein
MSDAAGTIPAAPPHVPACTLASNNRGNLRSLAQRVVDANDGETT